MSGLSTVPLSLVYVILLFVPGLLGLDLYLKSSQLVGRFTRLQYLAYSVFLSLLSLCLLYFLTPFYLGHFVIDVPFFPSDTHLATVPQLARLRLPDLVSLYILHVLSAGALGLAFGFFNREVLYADEERDRREPWAYAFDEAARPTEYIKVHLTSGKMIEGKWAREMWSEDARELYLKNPREIRFVDGDKEIKRADGRNTKHFARGIYIHVDAISQVELPLLDPQSELKEDKGESISDEQTSQDEELEEKLTDIGESLETLEERADDTESESDNDGSKDDSRSENPE